MSRLNSPGLAVVDLKAEETEADERELRHRVQAKAAGRADRDPARLGAEVSAEDRPSEESETADALKRAAKEKP